MLYFDTQKLSTGPKRTNPDSSRWKCLLIRLLPKTRARKFVTNSRTVFRSLKMDRPGSISSAAIRCSLSKLISGVKPFEEFPVFRFMLFDPRSSSLSVESASLAFVWERDTRPTPGPFYSITVRHAREHMVYKNTTPPPCPLYPQNPSPVGRKRRCSNACCCNWPHYFHSNAQTQFKSKQNESLVHDKNPSSFKIALVMLLTYICISCIGKSNNNSSLILTLDHLAPFPVLSFRTLQSKNELLEPKLI